MTQPPKTPESGLEALLAKAAADPALREALGRDRFAAAAAASVTLSATDRRILADISDEQLAMAVSIVRPAPRHGRPIRYASAGVRPDVPPDGRPDFVRGSRPFPLAPVGGRGWVAWLVLLTILGGAAALVWWLVS